jgi:hypothetical protein
MNCEICRTIERLGLDPSTHDPWFCCDAKPAVVKLSLTVRLAVAIASLHRITADYLLDHMGQAIGAGLHNLPANREHYIRLGL